MEKERKEFLEKLGFLPKDGAVNIYSKKYKQHNNYCINIDLTNEIINYGNLITSDCKTTQNFSQDENWVVLECVNRLLEKGYKPQNITLEKTCPEYDNFLNSPFSSGIYKTVLSTRFFSHCPQRENALTQKKLFNNIYSGHRKISLHRM